MKDLLDKLSSYNLFNYLLPGVLFAGLSKYVTDYDYIQENVVIGVFLYYFMGMVISRIGSIIIGPILQWSGFIKFAEYEDFVKGCKVDERIELFSEINNTYRTLISLFVVLLLLRLHNCIQVSWEITPRTSAIIGVTAAILLFVFSYKKQTKFVTKRVDIAKTTPKEKSEKK
ncbi:MAG: hypothetical protein IPK98_18475 [Chloracidobacterium sp.]|nr:hypothetical protein [Chloracidobacterium sp.]